MSTEGDAAGLDGTERWWFVVAVVGFVLNGVCYFTHLRTDGLFRHPPGTSLEHGIDLVWVFCAGIVVARAWTTRARHRVAIAALVVAVTVSRIEEVVGWREIRNLLEPLLWGALLMLCWRAFGRRLGGNADPR